MKGNYTALQLVSKHLLITGQTGSGKTTAALKMIMELKDNDQTVIVLDPTGEYGQQEGIVTYKLGENCFIDPGSLSATQLLAIMEIDSSILSKKVAAAIQSLRIKANLQGDLHNIYSKRGMAVKAHTARLNQLTTWMRNYNYKLLGQQVLEEFVLPYADERANYQLLGQEYNRPAINAHWDEILDLQGRNSDPLFQEIFGSHNRPGQSKLELSYVLNLFLKIKVKKRALVLDVSGLKQYSESQKQVLSLILQIILANRSQSKEKFPITIFIDEAHRYLPTKEIDLSQNGMFQLLREGRKYGLNLAVVTQSPLDLPASMLGQFPNYLIHHLANPTEFAALNAQGLNYAEISQLKVGQALVCLENIFMERE